ncbi:MAG: hypothetical protein KGL13_04750 [Gammaproteobacteria bacterium]|nr:hypothetical protein [Gammaproteobacteria bacterium]
MNTMKAYTTMARRELWEHRSLWLVQLVVAGILLLATLWGMGALIWSHAHGFLQGNSAVSMGDAQASVIAGAVVFNFALVLTACFYLMDCLYSDRKDRSVMFWRSMPVSDTAMVLSKLFTAMVTAPAIAFVVVVGFEIAAGLIVGAAGAVTGIGLLSNYHAAAVLLGWFTLAVAFLVQSLWLLPYYGWFLLCSAWARKLPLAWTVMVPLAMMLAELVVFHTHYISKMILGHLARWFGMLHSNQAEFVVGQSGIDQHGQLMTLSSVLSYLVRPEMWIGVIIGVVFTIGAVWLRRNRSEI